MAPHVVNYVRGGQSPPLRCRYSTADLVGQSTAGVQFDLRCGEAVIPGSVVWEAGGIVEFPLDDTLFPTDGIYPCRIVMTHIVSGATTAFPLFNIQSEGMVPV